MMNEGVAQSSQVQQMVAAVGPKWWCINNMRPPSQHQQHSFLAAPPQNLFPHQFIMSPLVASGASSWTDCQEPLPESWSQLPLGGLVSEEDYTGTREKGDRPILNQISTSNSTNYVATQDPVIKQENANVEFQLAAKSTNCWSSSSCVTTLSSSVLDFSHKSSDQCTSSTAAVGAAKKARIQASSSAQSAIRVSNSKVRKEKLGDRITALHQIVSPFGKTDTASVLLEAIGYIRFLQSQIEALSLPYLDSTSSGNIMQHKPMLGDNYIKRKPISEQECCHEEPKKDLKSRGLCLVPISCCTVEVGSQNGAADYWAPAFGPNFQ